MNACLFFEGTGQGVAGKITNVTRLYDACVEDDGQVLHLEPGLGTRFGAYIAGKIAGADWRASFRSARRWLESVYRSLPPDGMSTNVFVFGFSRGALLARHTAAWLDKLGIDVAYLGLWDTVDSTIGLDVSEMCPGNVKKARHAVSRDETRRFFQYVPLRSERKGVVEELVFPGGHSDVGGLYEDDHRIADVALAWIAAGAKRQGLRIKRGVRMTQKLDGAPLTLHDGHRDASNLWGAFDRVKRDLKGLKMHRGLVFSRVEQVERVGS